MRPETKRLLLGLLLGAMLSAGAIYGLAPPASVIEVPICPPCPPAPACEVSCPPAPACVLEETPCPECPPAPPCVCAHENEYGCLDSPRFKRDK